MKKVIYLSFDGTAYHGWQRQENAVTVQETLEKALNKLTEESIRATGCSRTDTGVHAKKFVCSFNTESKIPNIKFPLAVNAHLPDDIAVFYCGDADEKFHPRYDAKIKQYCYTIYNGRIRDPLSKARAWHYPVKLNLGKMQEASKYLIGTHDFSAFMATGSQNKTTVRTMKNITVDKKEDYIYINLWADGYLYNMVRIIAGTLAYAGCDKIKVNEIQDIIKSQTRERAGITAPPFGLMLMEVEY